MYRWLFLVVILFPIFVFAQSDNKIIINNEDFKNFVVNIAQGSKYNTYFTFSNTTNEEQNVIIKIVDDDHSLGQKTRFFDKNLDEEYKTQLEQNNNDISLFCQKKGDKEDIKEWCRGNKEIKTTIEANESVSIPTIIDIAGDEVDHSAQLVVVDIDDENNILSSVQISYEVPDKNITQITLNKFSLYKQNIFFDIKQWLNVGLRDKYITKFSIANTGTEDVHYEYCSTITSLWIGEDTIFCNNAIIKRGQTQKHDLDITAPRFGKVQITGSIQYNNSKGEKQKQISEPIDVFVWPVQLIIFMVVLICICFICVLIYKYINKNKNMFGFKKKKQKKEYTGTYVVNSTDNIISIAQLYNVPWKELARINEIESPYILIPGETISVPGGDEKEEEQGVEQKGPQDTSIAAPSQQSNVQQNTKQEPIVKAAQMATGANIAQNSQQQMPQQQISQQQTSASTKNIQSQTTQAESEPIKRKITYAAPEKMLTKPASEPTTSAIDIEWMKDDEDVYNEEMQIQRKKTNVRFIIITIIILIGVGLLSWWAVSWYLNSQQEETVSVEALIEEDSNNDNNASENNMSEETQPNDVQKQNNEDDNKNSEENTDSTSEEQGGSEQLESKDITVQVLNAGAPTGAAGTVTSEFDKKEYKTNNATNASNDYEGVVIYYSADKKDSLDEIVEIVGDKYGTPKQEESDAVTKKYNADIVVVIGS
jgi:LysM repeat protein